MYVTFTGKFLFKRKYFSCPNKEICFLIRLYQNMWNVDYDGQAFCHMAMNSIFRELLAFWVGCIACHIMFFFLTLQQGKFGFSADMIIQ